ncbi:ribonuclease H-like domain-containing protein [Mycena vitilis]|nr:ribonuclease H-like domain-containing protein [Mycena vitilis]
MSKKLGSTARPTAAPSSNWLALQKILPTKPGRKRDGGSQDMPRKRRKIDHSRSPSPRASPPPKTKPLATEIAVDAGVGEMKNGESLSALRRMVFGQVEYTEIQQQPGKYLALDCEMVGVGPEGAESSLARVSLVNFHGAVQLDEFVRQRERVVDYRTEFSGVRETDMIKAKPFTEIQALVAALLTDRILVGHAVHNDLKALLLSHPHAATRDTQYYAGKFGVVKSKRIALRKLVQQEVGATIQGGEHSSVTDARATIAVYRLHRKEWERSAPRPSSAALSSARKRAVADADAISVINDAEESDGEESDASVVVTTKSSEKKSSTTTITMTKTKTEKKTYPGGGRKGVSSGLSTVVRRKGGAAASTSTRASGGGGGGGEKTAWWKELGGGKKGSMRL